MTDWAAQTWRQQAVCAQLADWHQATVEEQRDVCSTCPVRQECLSDALTEHTDGGYPYGMRGGLTEDERVARLTGLGRQPRGGPRYVGRAPAPIIHGTYAGHRQHTRRREPSCDPCFQAARIYRRAAEKRKAAS